MKRLSDYFSSTANEQPKKKQCLSPPVDTAEKKWHTNILGVSGLCYFPEFISNDEEINLLESVDTGEWSNELKRRVQHYGYKYNYKSRTIGEEDKLGELPEWVSTIVEKLQGTSHPLKQNSSSIWPKNPDQLIVNEYLPGQGISAHVDSKVFEDTIISISLGSNAVMEFSPTKAVGEKDTSKVTFVLERCSAVLLFGDARYLWKHAIPARKTDKKVSKLVVGRDGKISTSAILSNERQRRVSLTLRKTKT